VSSVLRKRIARQPKAMKAHAADHFQPLEASAPAGAAAMGNAAPPPPQAMVMPLTLVQVTASGVQVSEATPLYAGPRGAPIPATAPGRWQQLYAAGRA
jgi:hypothetical protein